MISDVIYLVCNLAGLSQIKSEISAALTGFSVGIVVGNAWDKVMEWAKECRDQGTEVRLGGSCNEVGPRTHPPPPFTLAATAASISPARPQPSSSHTQIRCYVYSGDHQQPTHVGHLEGRLWSKCSAQATETPPPLRSLTPFLFLYSPHNNPLDTP
jgi:hypothetical protein